MTNLDITKAYVGSTEVSKVYIGDSQVYPSGPPPTPVYSAMPLTFEIISGGTILWYSKNASKEIEYKLNNGEWTSITSSTATSISVEDGDKVQFRGYNDSYGVSTSDADSCSFIGSGGTLSSAIFNVYGNIMSLIDGDNFEGLQFKTDGSNDDAFCSLFNYFDRPSSITGPSCLQSAENLVLPDNVVTGCYQAMFTRNLGLIYAPKLPATILAERCYRYMFAGCLSLTTAPELPATTLVTECYRQMFYRCHSLNYIKCLATNISGTNCTSNWVDMVDASGTFVRNPDFDRWSTGNSGIPNGWTVSPTMPYFAFNIISGGTIVWKKANASAPDCQISYSMDDAVTWTTISPTTAGTSFNVSAGDKVLFKGDNSNYCVTATTTGATQRNYYDCFAGTALFEAEGNIMSLINSGNFTIGIPLPSSGWNFKSLFQGCTGIVSAENLKLPASALTMCCYRGMFDGCTNLTKAPELPATNISNADACYAYMFQSCPITVAPELPATTLATSCYQSMFRSCSSLHYIKCLATNISAIDCTYNWVNGVDSSGLFECVILEQWPTGSNGIPNGWPAVDVFDYIAAPLTFKVLSGGTTNWRADNTAFTKTIFYKVNDGEWTSITSTTAGTPMSFNAGDVVQFKGDGPCATGNGYTNRFRDASTDLRYNVYGNIMSLVDSTGYTTATTVDDHALRQEFSMQPVVSAKKLVLQATTVKDNGYKQMFDRCTYLTSAPPELPATTVGVSAYQNMFQGCTSLTKAPLALLADTIGDQCYEKMFSGCTSLVTPPATIGTTAMTMAASACSNMFYNCTSLSRAPELPAATLNVACYSNMFRNCGNLNYIKCLATDNSASNCTSNWLSNVAATGTFVKDANMTSWPTDSPSGIPHGWTVRDAS